jgi:hypothetical protein
MAIRLLDVAASLNHSLGFAKCNSSGDSVRQRPAALKRDSVPAARLTSGTIDEPWLFV